MKISIITATYNSATTIERCLCSVAEQTAISQIEHIIVDGRSSDETLTFVSTFSHIAKVISEADNGVYDAFNKGLAVATGDLIYYLNSDDHLSDKQVISDILAEFEKEKKIDYLAARVVIKDPVTNAEWVLHEHDLLKGQHRFRHPHHQGFFMKRALLQEYGGFPRAFDIAADSYIMLKAILFKHGVFFDRAVAHFYLGGLSSNIENYNLINRETRIIYELLDLERVNQQDVALALANKNMTLLKRLFHSYLEKENDVSVLKGRRIGIFGTGIMASIIYMLLEKSGVVTDFFITSLGSDSTFNGRQVWSLHDFPSNVDILFNSVEGEHGDEIVLKLQHKAPVARIIKWHEIYE
ncbi:glycosyltransferase family 2 protein [Aeromonas enteropelogenes]|uniref:glycosyltransferase family 2 protein n=1 Tax=Aeromonas enteropelogenes TaxID=29489 RepID=UPI003B9F8D5F